MNRLSKPLCMMVVCIFVLIVLPSHARDWGFSKDTVYEVEQGAPEEIEILNLGDASLNIDSAWVEVIEPQHPEQFYYAISQSWSGLLYSFPRLYWGKFPFFDDRGNVTDSVLFVWPKNYVLDTTDHEKVEFVLVNGFLKNEKFLPETDRVVLRNIFRAKDRGFDTLVVIGNYHGFCCIPETSISQYQKTHQKPLFKYNPRFIPIDGRWRPNSQMPFQ